MKKKLAGEIFVFLIFLLVCVQAAGAVEIYVYPQQQQHSESMFNSLGANVQYPNIQAAIDASNNGDIIYLAPGRFKGEGNRDLDYKGKAITISGLDPNDPNIVAATIIDCEGLGRGFIFDNNETSNSVLQGITITNGCFKNEYSEIQPGGAIYFESSSPKIFKCNLIQNKGYYGGAFYLTKSNPLILECSFINNQATDYSGGGLFLGLSSPIIKNCIIKGNICERLGGGISLVSSNPLIEGCTISDNQAYDNWGQGGGICTWYSSPVISNCLITSNYAGLNGAGIYCGYQGLQLILNCTVSLNKIGRGAGAGIVTENTFPLIINSIVYFNYPIESKQIALFDWNGMGYYPSICDISYSDIQGGELGIYVSLSVLNYSKSNLGIDPCFVTPSYWDANGTPNDANDDFWVNGDYHLKSQGWRWDKTANQWTWDNVTSRCIDAGSPGYSLGDEPMTLLVDPLNRFGVNKRIDMGCYGGTAEASMPPYDWALLSDMDNNGKVDFVDYSYLTQLYGSSGEKLDGDLNRDGKVDMKDLKLFAADWLGYTDWAF
jgi:parallel beta-helix repeat protein